MIANVLITDVVPYRLVGVYDNGGVWTQASGANFATDLAVLQEVPTEAGIYAGDIYQDTDTYYSADYVFTATFAPDEVGRVDCLYTADTIEFESTGCGVEQPVSYSDLAESRILEQYK
jgi:hypothetical protein